MRVLLGTACLAAPRLSAESSWHVLRVPEFSVMSELSEKDTRAWAGEFSQFVEALREVVPVDPMGLPPLTVVLFAKPREFAPFRPLGSDGKPMDIAGFFSRHPTWAIIGLASRRNDAETRHVIFHEGVHWCLSRRSAEYPLWLNEGLAEVFSTFRIEDGKVRWGDPILGHIALLREAAPLPVGKLVAVTRDNPLYYAKHRIGIFYAESWILTHYLLFGGRPGARTDLAYYLGLLKSGTPPEKAFEQAFGTDYAGMDENLAQYARAGSCAVAIKDLPEGANAAGEFTEASPLVVEKTLETLAYSSGRVDVARAIAAESSRVRR